MRNPQTLNLYSYAGNNPLSNVDPGGHDCIYATGVGSGYEVKSGDCYSDTDSGIYVNGTVTSANYNASNNSIGYTYTAYDTGNLGTGVIANVPAPQPMDGGAVTPGDDGLGAIAGGMAIDYAVGRVLGALGLGVEEAASSTAPNVVFGTDAESAAHTMRHVASEGLNPEEVQGAIKSDIGNGANIRPDSNTRYIEVDGKTLRYNARKLPNGTINVGKIVVEE